MTARPEPDAAPPRRTVAGRYALERPIGRGGMGTVWLALDVVLQRQVAVKEVMYPDLVSEEERSLLEQRTMREARAAAQLSSPRATTVHDVVDEGGRPWIVMEYVESRTLGDVMRERGTLPPVDVARIGLDVLDALEAAHAVGVVHRDVKPGNVLLDRDGRAWLTDFGIATSVTDVTLSDEGVLVGSPSFMSPERAHGDEAGPFTDLWSLGATLYAAVEGRAPFERGEAMATLLAVTTEPPTPPERAGPLGPVLLALLEKEPGQRLTGPAARDALRRVVDGATPPAQPPTSPPPPPQQRPPQPDRAAAPEPEQLARIDRAELARLAGLAGRSFAEGAKRAAVAGLTAWADSASGPPKEGGRGRLLPPGHGQRREELARMGRHSVRWTKIVASLIAVGLVLGIVLIVVLVVLTVG